MSSYNKNYLTTVIILLITSIVVLNMEYGSKVIADIDLKDLPVNVGQWYGEDIELSERVYEILETRDVIMRRYQNSNGDEILLSIVYSGNNRDSFHPPEYCYIGGGAELLAKNQEDIALDNGSILSTYKIRMGDAYGKISAWYWFSANKRFISSYYLQQAYMLWDALRGKDFSGALIRVSVRGDNSELENKAKIFIAQAYPALRDIF